MSNQKTMIKIMIIQMIKNQVMIIKEIFKNHLLLYVQLNIKIKLKFIKIIILNLKSIHLFYH